MNERNIFPFGNTFKTKYLVTVIPAGKKACRSGLGKCQPKSVGKADYLVCCLLIPKSGIYYIEFRELKNCLFKI